MRVYKIKQDKNKVIKFRRQRSILIHQASTEKLANNWLENKFKLIVDKGEYGLYQKIKNNV